MKKIFLALTLILALSVAGLAQSNSIYNTTLSVALSTTASTMTVASATNLAVGQVAVIQQEMVLLTSISGTNIGISRGYSGTTASSHPSAATVRAQAANLFYSNRPNGACTRSSTLVLPYITVDRAAREINTYDCQNGYWVRVTNPDQVLAGPVQFCSVPVGSVAYGSFGNATTLGGSGYLYVTSVYLPQTTLLTGVKVLQNGTVGSNNLIAGLYEAGGTLVANSALAGVVTVGANTFLSLPFTSTYMTYGPGRYWIGIQGNGTTDGIRTIAASTFVDTLSTLRSSGTFGTLGTFTVPTTFTANQGPIACLY